MEEYIIKKDLRSNIQKFLNQWKHDYILDIINIESVGNGDYMVLTLKRTKK